MKDRFKVVDRQTGELQGDGFVAVIQPKRRNGFDEGWAAMAQNALEFLADNRGELGEEGFAVFAKLVSRMDANNFMQINQTALGRALNMRQPNVNRAIKKLMKLGVLLEGPKVGRCRTYRLNPQVGWKGAAKDHKKALRDIPDHLKIIDGGKSDGDAHTQQSLDI